MERIIELFTTLNIVAIVISIIGTITAIINLIYFFETQNNIWKWITLAYAIDTLFFSYGFADSIFNDTSSLILRRLGGLLLVILLLTSSSVALHELRIKNKKNIIDILNNAIEKWGYNNGNN